MLNLSDIRKKARKEGKPQPPLADATAPVEASAAAAEAVATAPAVPSRQEPAKADALTDGARRQPSRKANSRTADETRTADPDGERTRDTRRPAKSSLDPLESLFALSDELDLATEESYFAGLARNAEDGREQRRQMLSFALGAEEYMVDIRQVREIIKVREITEIPRAPYFILGVISLRGNIIPVYDLKKRLKLGAVELSPDNRVVVCQAGEKAVGLLVEKINEVIRLFEREIESTPAMLSGLDRELVEGVGRHEGRMLILLDLANVLDAELY